MIPLTASSQSTVSTPQSRLIFVHMPLHIPLRVVYTLPIMSPFGLVTGLTPHPPNTVASLTIKFTDA
eukprot:2097167-Ditylum_brightwellii.AAC.2